MGAGHGAHLFFPSYYHHFGAAVPWGFGNDGLLDIRLLVSRDGTSLSFHTTFHSHLCSHLLFTPPE